MFNHVLKMCVEIDKMEHLVILVKIMLTAKMCVSETKTNKIMCVCVWVWLCFIKKYIVLRIWDVLYHKSIVHTVMLKRSHSIIASYIIWMAMCVLPN